jgi:hypothetical protein
MRKRLSRILEPLGQPAIDAIFRSFENVKYVGNDNANYRKELYDLLTNLGKQRKSVENFKRIKQLQRKEIQNGQNHRTELMNAVSQAVIAMEP